MILGLTQHSAEDPASLAYLPHSCLLGLLFGFVQDFWSQGSPVPGTSTHQVELLQDLSILFPPTAPSCWIAALWCSSGKESAKLFPLLTSVNKNRAALPQRKWDM